MSTTRKLLILAGAVLGVVALLTLGPAELGGSNRIIVSSGSSMEPEISSGDLILVRARSSYEVGDVVAYRSPDLGTVLHRIIDVSPGIDGDRFILQGDNNDFVDAEELSEGAIIGEMVFAVPRGGQVLGLLPVLAAAGFSVYWLVGSRRRSVSPAPVSAASFTTRRVVGLFAVVVFGGIGVLAAFSPTSVTRERDIRYDSTIDVGWAAEPEASVVYPGGLLRTGDPVFVNEIEVIGVWADVEAAATGEDVTGTVALTAEVSNESGWSHRINLGRPAPVEDGTAEVRGDLDLGRLQVVLDRVASRTGYSPTEYDVALVVSGLVRGRVSGQRFEDEVVHQVALTMDELVLGPTEETVWTTQEPGTVMVQESVETQLGIGVIALPVGLLRVLAPFAMIVGLVLVFRPTAERTAAEVINGHFEGYLVEVNSAALPTDAPTVTLDRFEDLLRMAEIEGTPILHVDGEHHQWATLAMGIWYRYQLSHAAAEAHTERGLSRS